MMELTVLNAKENTYYKRRHPSEAKITVCRNVILIIATKMIQLSRKDSISLYPAPQSNLLLLRSPNYTVLRLIGSLLDPVDTSGLQTLPPFYGCFTMSQRRPQASKLPMATLIDYEWILNSSP
jgi:hypothetical protein